MKGSAKITLTKSERIDKISIQSEIASPNVRLNLSI